MQPPEILINRWLEKLLKHFGIRELGETSDQRFAAIVANCCKDDSFEDDSDLLSLDFAHPDSLHRQASLQSQWLQDDRILSELKRRVVRLAGAQLNDMFVAMAPDVLDVEDVELASTMVEGRMLQGVRHEGDIYRLIDTFEHCHRLQAFCLAQTLEEQRSSYLITRSDKCFSVWVNVQALPHRGQAQCLAA